jgi:glyoxylate reductase
MMRVLIADSLARFVNAARIPADLAVDLFAPASIPPGDFVGLMPDITRRVTARDIAGLPALRVIANYGVGYDNIDLAAAAGRGIPVSNTPGVLSAATAELTWALILALTRRIGEGERLVRARNWQGWQPTHMLGRGLDGKVLGIVGAGRIGREVGNKASVFGMRVVYSNRTRHEAWERALGAEWLPLDELLARADVVTLHQAWTADTNRVIGATQLERMKRDALLINTARGAIVDQGALAAALRSGALRGAGLDVYEHEPDVPRDLLELENVVLLPHLGSATEEARRAMWELAWQNLLAGVRGAPLLNPIFFQGSAEWKDGVGSRE